MAQLEEIAYDIMSNLSGTSRISDDTDIELEQIYYKIDSVRAILIRQDQAKGRSLSSNIIQTLPCLKVKQVSASECCDVELDCTVMRTVLQIPKPIELYQKDLIVRVAGADITGPSWNMLSLAKLSWSGKSKWTKDSTKWFYRNGYIYILNPPILTNISVSGVFENPRVLGTYQNCSGEPCFNEQSDYPISGHMLPVLKQMVIEDMTRQVQAPADHRGDESSKVQNKLE